MLFTMMKGHFVGILNIVFNVVCYTFNLCAVMFLYTCYSFIFDSNNKTYNNKKNSAIEFLLSIKNFFCGEKILFHTTKLVMIEKFFQAFRQCCTK